MSSPAAPPTLQRKGSLWSKIRASSWNKFIIVELNSQTKQLTQKSKHEKSVSVIWPARNLVTPFISLMKDESLLWPRGCYSVYVIICVHYTCWCLCTAEHSTTPLDFYEVKFYFFFLCVDVLFWGGCKKKDMWIFQLCFENQGAKRILTDECWPQIDTSS